MSILIHFSWDYIHYSFQLVSPYFHTRISNSLFDIKKLRYKLLIIMYRYKSEMNFGLWIQFVDENNTVFLKKNTLVQNFIPVLIIKQWDDSAKINHVDICLFYGKINKKKSSTIFRIFRNRIQTKLVTHNFIYDGMVQNCNGFIQTHLEN